MFGINLTIIIPTSSIILVGVIIIFLIVSDISVGKKNENCNGIENISYHGDYLQQEKLRNRQQISGHHKGRVKMRIRKDNFGRASVKIDFWTSHDFRYYKNSVAITTMPPIETISIKYEAS